MCCILLRGVPGPVPCGRHHVTATMSRKPAIGVLLVPRLAKRAGGAPQLLLQLHHTPRHYERRSEPRPEPVTRRPHPRQLSPAFAPADHRRQGGRYNARSTMEWIEPHLEFLVDHLLTVVFAAFLVEAAGVPFPTRLLLLVAASLA